MQRGCFLLAVVAVFATARVDAQPEVDVVDMIDFGQVIVGQTEIVAFMIGNTGDADLAVTNITMSDGDAPPKNNFDVPLLSGDFPPAFPIMIPAGTSKMFNVIYTPSVVGSNTDSLEIDTNDVNVEVALEGEGVNPPAPDIGTIPSSIEFGTRPIGSASGDSIRIENQGNSPLSIASIVLSGAGRTAYSLGGLPAEGPIVLDRNESMVVSVFFRPIRTGRAFANVVITSNDPDEGTVTVALTGTGILQDRPDIGVDPDPVDFGSVFVGAAATLTLTITNDGSDLLIVTGIALAQDGSPDFAITSELALPIELAPGGSAPIDLTYTPSAEGPAAGAIEIASNDPDEALISVDLAGTGDPTPEPEITVETDPSIDLGQVAVGSSATGNATVRNTGVAILNVLSIGLSEGTSSEFTYEGPESVSLVPGAEVILAVTYTPVDEGYDQGTLVIVSEDPDESTIEVPVTGTGSADPSARIDVETDPALAYGQVSQNTTVTQVITIHNVGSADLEVSDVVLGDGTSADYSITDAPVLPVTIASGSNVTVTVAYTPSGLGFDSGTVVITSSDEANPSVTVSLTGIGVEQAIPVIEVDPDALDHGDVNLGEDSTLTITVRNLGSADLHVNVVALGDGSSDQFSIGDLVLPATVVPQGELPIDVTFTPTAAGAANGTVVIESDDPDNAAVVVSVNGNGVEAAPAPEAGADPAELNYGDVEIGTTSTLQLTVSNNGGADLTVTSIGLGDGTSANFSLSGVPAAGTSILMLGGNVAADAGADGAVFDFLAGIYGAAAALGDPGVFYMRGEDTTSDDALLVDVLYISSTLGSGTVRGKFEDTPTPTINCEQALMHAGQAGNFFMSTTGQTSDGHTQLDILAPGHPLAAGLEGTVDVFTDPQILSVGNPPLAPGVVAVAQATTDANLQGIFAAEAGAELLGDGSDDMPATAAGRRVMFFLEDNGFSAITDDGRALLAAAVEWLAQPAVAVIEPGGSITVDVSYTPDAEATDTGTVQIETDGGNLSVPLNGTGVAGAIMQIRISPPSVDFGGTLIGSTNSADVTIRNLGTADLDLSGVALGVGTSQSFAIVEAPASMKVEPGAETMVKVSYTPVVIASDSGTIRISSNDENRPEVAVSLFGFGAGESAPVFKRGDANSDSTVDISDVVKTLMYLFGSGSAPDCHDAADSNDDGSLDVSDGLFTVTRLFGGSTETLPPAADACAVDASADSLPDCNYPLHSCGI